ncbi:LCP family protein [Candidatus Margulisiibacteriota bacterium]
MFRKVKLSKQVDPAPSRETAKHTALRERPRTRRKTESILHQQLRYRDEKPRRSRKPLLIAAVLIFLILFSSTLGVVISISAKFALLETFLTMMSASGFSSETNILVVGLDSGRRYHRADTIMILNVDPNTQKVSVVSIPRDTLLRVPGMGLTKVNHSFVYGGSKLTKKALEDFLDVRIPFTVAIDMSGLANVIDALGGITVDVEKRMYYVDYAGGLYINLYPGRQVLSGRRAIGYVRFRNDGRGDFGRISRQQKFVKALAQKIITHKSVLKTPKLIMSLLSNIDTNLSSRQIMAISMSMRQALDIGNIEMATIPGSGVMIDKVYYMKPNMYETRRIVTKLLKPGKSAGYVESGTQLGMGGASQ